MTCTDKFHRPISLPENAEACDFSSDAFLGFKVSREIEENIKQYIETDANILFAYVRDNMPVWSFGCLYAVCRMITDNAINTKTVEIAVSALTMLNDLRYSVGEKKRSHILHIIRNELSRLFQGLPLLGKSEKITDNNYRLIDFHARDTLRAPKNNETTLVINAHGFPAEGDACDASLLMHAYMKGWRRFISFGCIGQRYVGTGLGPDTDDVVIDVYDSSGDYLASGIDGLKITVHNNAQDQLGQIIKRGTLVIYGDVGQTFLYGAKGGAIYVMGNAAGRPLINSVGKPRVIINGTCLDFLAESFMAGDPHNEGGFVILNGVRFDDDGRLIEMNEPYPGSNIFSLASGGAIYIRDPRNTLVKQQLNGGVIEKMNEKDWDLILPYLKENERLFNIKIEDLLTVKGERIDPLKVYRKVVPFVSAKLAGDKLAATIDDEFVEEEVVYETNVGA